MTGSGPVASERTDPDQFLAHMAQNLVQNSDVSINLGATLIVTTEDKIKLAMHTHLQRMADRSAWLAPLGILATIVVTFPTTDFKAFWFLSADSWRALFVMGALMSLAWLVRTGWRAWKAPSEEDFLAALRVAPNAGSATTDAARAGPDVPIEGRTLDLTRMPERARHRPRRALRDLLLTSSWTLIYNASTGASKPISFNPDGTIGLGRNQNEDRWELIGERLVIINPAGAVHSRFTCDASQKSWTQTSDVDTPHARDQRLVEESELRYRIKFT